MTRVWKGELGVVLHHSWFAEIHSRNVWDGEEIESHSRNSENGFFWMFEVVSSSIFAGFLLPLANIPMSGEENNDMEAFHNDQSEFEIKEEQTEQDVQASIASMIASRSGIQDSEVCSEEFEEESGNLDESAETEPMDNQGAPIDHAFVYNFSEMFSNLQEMRQGLHDRKEAVEILLARLKSYSNLLKIEPLVNRLF